MTELAPLLRELVDTLHGLRGRHFERLALGGDALLSPTEAARLLPCRDSAAMAWLRRHDLVRHDPELGDAVLWRDVTEAWAKGPQPVDASHRRSGRLRRAVL